MHARYFAYSRQSWCITTCLLVNATPRQLVQNCQSFIILHCSEIRYVYMGQIKVVSVDSIWSWINVAVTSWSEMILFRIIFSGAVRNPECSIKKIHITGTISALSSGFSSSSASLAYSHWGSVVQIREFLQHLQIARFKVCSFRMMDWNLQYAISPILVYKSTSNLQNSSYKHIMLWNLRVNFVLWHSVLLVASTPRSTHASSLNPLCTIAIVPHHVRCPE